MRLRITALAIGVLAALTAIAKEYKIGYVDSDRVIARYEAAVEAKRQLDAEIDRFEVRAESLKAEYDNAKQEYESQELTLSEEGKRAKQAEVDQRKRRYEAYLSEVYGREGRIEQKNRELIAPIVQKIDSAVAKLAAEERFSLVVDASKAGIIFAEPGLDLTQLVVDELNREYTPVTPTQQRKLFVVTIIWETNEQARQDRIGEKIRTFSYDFVQAAPNVEMVASRKADEIAQERNLSGQQIQLDQALEIARALDADYVVYGFCSQHDRRTNFELSVADVRLSVVKQAQAGEAEREELLREQVGSVVRVLLSSVQDQ
ncbi:OmpH family outer membrane protein [candidate division WOR-3 bacterium]|nr:OmpH family outer membrane protein [candidate division WOR-3 bacterium]